jgi:hypothetical protein
VKSLISSSVSGIESDSCTTCIFIARGALGHEILKSTSFQVAEVVFDSPTILSFKSAGSKSQVIIEGVANKVTFVLPMAFT